MNLPTYPPGRILRREEAAPWLEGFSFLQAARAQAQRLTADAERTFEEARRRGLEQGRAEGRQQAEQAWAEQRARLDQWLAEAEPALAELALGIARQLIGDLPPGERLVALTRQALKDFRHGQALALRLPDGELETARRSLADAGLNIAVEADPLLPPGQACLGHAQGSVELEVDAQLAQVRQALVPQVDGPSLP